MKQLLENDLKYGFNFYPSSGYDFEMMKNIEDKCARLNNCFVFCDVGDYPKKYGMTPSMNFLDNQLGLEGYKIESKQEIEDFLELVDSSFINSLNKLYGPEYKQFCSMIPKRNVIRYEFNQLLLEENIVLYFFSFDALTVLRFLLSIEGSKFDMLILHAPQGGWIDQSDYLLEIEKTFTDLKKSPCQLVSRDIILWKTKFTHPEYFEDLNCRFQVESMNIRMNYIIELNPTHLQYFENLLRTEWCKLSAFCELVYKTYKRGL
jgi:hypothetical protein